MLERISSYKRPPKLFINTKILNNSHYLEEKTRPFEKLHRVLLTTSNMPTKKIELPRDTHVELGVECKHLIENSKYQGISRQQPSPPTKVEADKISEKSEAFFHKL